MATKYLGDAIYKGLSTDTKPTTAITNSIFIETDTRLNYIYDGTTWQNQSAAFVGGYNAIIYKVGSTYKSKKFDGTLLASSTTLDSVVQAALDVKGLIKWPASNDGLSFNPSNSVAWNVYSDTWLDMSGAWIVVPSTYSGTLFTVDDTTGGAHVAEKIIMQGGFIQQGGATPSATWTGLDIKSTGSTAGNSGVSFCQFRNMYIKRAGVGVKLTSNAGTQSFITGCTLDSITAYTPNVGFEFLTTGSGSVAVASRNTFINCIAQADTVQTSGPLSMSHGFKNISNKNNAFIHCKAWDVTGAGNVCSNITNTAEDTIIIGGLMTYVPYDWEISQDLGKRTHATGDPVSANAGLGLNTALSNPFIRKVGVWHGGALTGGSDSAGDGLLSAFRAHGTGTISNAIGTNGIGKRAATGASVNTVAGLRNGTIFTIRHFNPFTAIRFSLNQTTNQRVFVGYCTSTNPTMGTADDPLANLHGYGLYHSTTHGTSATNWLVSRNTGAASSTIEDTGVAANNTDVKNIYVAGWENGPKFNWRIDQTYQISNNDHTTTIPAQTSGLTFGIWISNTAAEDKTLDVFAVFFKNNKSEMV